MVLESTMICVDNSDYMRNQDFLPTRLHAQQDAVYLVCNSKLRSNPENSVGLLTLAGVGVLVTLTSNVGRILTKLHQVQPYGSIDLHTGIKVANLALKHRQDKNHRKRIVAFVASPVTTEEVDLVRLAKNLKKEKVNLDIVSFGEDNTDVFTCFINTLNGKDGTGSHLVEVPSGLHLSDILITSPIIQDEDGGGVTAIGFNIDVDPNEDPELALALRISLEEERRRQEEEARKAREETSVKTDVESPAMPNTAVEFADMTEQEQLAFAIRMSMPSGRQTPSSINDEDYAEVMNDPDFLRSALENLPGVDPNSETIRRVVNDLKRKKEKEKNEKQDK